MAEAIATLDLDADGPDWDAIFASVILACHLDYSVIALWTPRQLQAISEESRRQSFAASGKSETDGDELPDDEPQARLPGAQGVRGMGLEKYPCWKPYPGENDNDPFSVPREIVKERWYALLYEACKQDGLGKYGVRKDDMDGLRDLFDKTWSENCANFEKLKAAKEQEKQDGIRPDQSPGFADADA